jgi:predicted restriction endonuclease
MKTREYKNYILEFSPKWSVRIIDKQTGVKVKNCRQWFRENYSGKKEYWVPSKQKNNEWVTKWYAEKFYRKYFGNILVDKNETYDRKELLNRATEASNYNTNHPEEKKEIKNNVIVYKRDKYIRELVKNDANGICADCGKEIGKDKLNNIPELQVHHIKFLSDGGIDEISNCVALCPNCHRRRHKDKKDE